MFRKLEVIICLGILTILSVQDLRYRKVSVSILIVAFLLICTGLFRTQMDMILPHVLGLASGGLFLVLSRVTREGIGYGDSGVICLFGLYLGIWNLVELLMISWVLLGAAALLMLFAKRRSKGTAIPAVPFFAAAYLLMLFMRGGEL